MDENKHDLSSLVIDKSKRNGITNPDKSKMKWVIIAAAAILLAAALFYLASPSMFVQAVEVKTTTVVLQTPSQTNAILTASGYIVAQRKAAVASKGTGRLVYLGVVEGDVVRKDQVIARLEDSDIRAQLNQAIANVKLYEADLRQSEKAYNRAKELLKTGSATDMDFEMAEANYNKVLSSIEVAKTQVEAAKVALENMLIRAPFDGTVLTKNADVGEIVAPLAGGVNSKAAVVTIADMGSLQAEVDVSESNIEKINIGQDCDITLDAYPAQKYDGYVNKVVPTADRTKGTVMVKVAFKNYDKRVLPEMSTKVNFLSQAVNKTREDQDQKPVLIAPTASVVKRNNKEYVYTIEQGKAHEVQVYTGKSFNNYIEILSGVGDGNKVIDNPDASLKEGTKVIVK